MTYRHSGIRFVVNHTIEHRPVGDTASRVAAAMVSKLRVHAATNVVELFVQTLVVLQTMPILNSGFVTWPNDPLRSCSFHAEIVEVEIGGVAIYCPIGEFRRAKSYCHLYDTQIERQAYPIPL
ncbi:hypothetical protein TNCV_1194951 [Trichonephila clavipes]|nr:hypothetical protein TNCV_1194951 [Trichonephila clavipes]